MWPIGNVDLVFSAPRPLKRRRGASEHWNSDSVVGFEEMTPV